MNYLIGVADVPPVGPSLRVGKLIAQTTAASVTVLHVAGPDEDEVRGQEILAAASVALGDIPHQTRLAQGKPAQAILRVAREEDFDLVVVGAQRIREDGDASIGSVARQVVIESPISTLLAKGTPASLDRVLVCSGGRSIAEPVIAMGAQLAHASSAKATLLHVSSAVPSMYTGLVAMEESIEDLLSTNTPEAQHLRQGAEIFEQHNVEAVLELRHGVATDEIIRSCRMRDYDLLIVGAADSAPRLNRLFFGQVTQQIVERSPISVLVVRNGQ